MTGIEVGTLLTIGSLALSGLEAVGAIVKGNAQARAAETNAQISEAQARQQQLVAAENERRQRRDTERRLGAAAANRGASGVAMEGSPLDVFADEAAEGELVALDIRYGGLMSARNLQSQAAMDRAEASRLRSGGLWSAAGVLLGAGLNAGRSLIGGGRPLGGGNMAFAQAAQTRAASTRGRTPF